MAAHPPIRRVRRARCAHLNSEPVGRIAPGRCGIRSTARSRPAAIARGPFAWATPAPILAAALLLASARPARGADEIHYTLLGPSGVSFDWRGTETTLRYGLTPAYTGQVTAHPPTPIPPSSPGPFQQAEISGLEPDTDYHYAIGSGADHTFHTAPARGSSDFTICVEGDIGSDYYSTMPPVQALIAQVKPRFVLGVGDLTYGDEQGPTVVDAHFNDVMVWSTDAAYMPVWGNHEWQPAAYTDSLSNYKGRFELPNPQTSPGSPSPGGSDWYWFDYGNLRFIAYPEPWTGALEAWVATARKLMDDAQADPAIAGIVTFGHRPAYSTGDHPGSRTFQSYFDSLGVTHPKYVLDLSGHDHDYQRTVPLSGVTHIVAGIGGAGLTADSTSCHWSVCPAPEWIATRAIHHGALELTVHPDRIDGVALCGPAGRGDDIVCSEGAVFDRFTIPLGGRRSVLTAEVIPTPAATTSRLQFTTHTEGAMRVTLYDVRGRHVSTVTDEVAAPPGLHEVPLASAGLRSGIYFYRIETSEGSATGRLVLLK